jgi:uncharacterized Zn finger protein
VEAGSVKENARLKAARYLADNRVRILECCEEDGTLSAEVRGNGSIYIVAREGELWACSCPALSENCAHVLACKSVTVFEPRETR